MMRIEIAYHSEAGHTLALAQAVADGASPTARLLDVTAMPDDGWDRLARADAIVFGCPTYMGGISAPMKAFIDATSDFWEDQPWADKLAAGFTIGSRFSGDKLATLTGLAIFAAQHSMIWVGLNITGDRSIGAGPRGLNADGAMLGMVATSSGDRAHPVPLPDLETARAFGARIAKAVRRWQTERT